MKVIVPVADRVLLPLVYLAAELLKALRKAGLQTMPLCKKALLKVGVFPILNHYYEPLFDGRMLSRPLNQDRALPGIDWNVAEQLDLLRRFDFNDELADLPTRKPADLGFYFNNGAFESGDAEYFYNLIRLKKPKRIFEVGSGNSTLLARRALSRNREETPSYACEHLCIEPYEMPWLEKTGVTVVRSRVEAVERSLFRRLEENDILFIDSSHIIRPQGDVLFEYLEILPLLNPGVIVHVHDIFSPNDYPTEWVLDQVKFWNEQYLLEAFLTSNCEWKVLGALNFLHHKHFQELRAKCPFLTEEREPGSFYLQKRADS